MEARNTTIATANSTADDDSRGDEILIVFAQAEPEANAAEWANRYPQYAGEIARFAADRWAGESVAMAAETVSVARLRELGRETVRACRAAASVPAPTPLTSLIAAAKVCGLNTQSLAARLEVPYATLFKLQRRLIVPASIPRTLVQSLADTLQRTADEIAAYLRQSPTLAMGASYRSDDTPEAGAQESFADALHADPEATDAHHARWLAAE